MTRRRLFALCACLLASAALVRPAAAAADEKAAADPKPIKALMICGGCCHDYTNQKKILSEGIAARTNI